MIVVIGTPMVHAPELGGGPAGTSALAAVAAAKAGASVQLAGRIGDDPEGDALSLALARAGVGHAALLRDPARQTPVVLGEAPDGVIPDEDGDAAAVETIAPADPDQRPALERADVELALRYLTDFAVLVVAEPQPTDVVDAAAEAARYAGARLIVAVAEGAGPPDAIVLRAPEWDPDGAFGTLLGEYAAALDAGGDPEAAFREVTARLGWERPPA